MNTEPMVPAAQQPVGNPTTENPAETPRYTQRLKEGQFSVLGEVVECLPNTMFFVEVTESQVPQLVGKKLLFTLAGKMRLNRIRVMPGDKVMGYVTKYDLEHGKITFRMK